MFLERRLNYVGRKEEISREQAGTGQEKLGKDKNFDIF